MQFNLLISANYKIHGKKHLKQFQVLGLGLHNYIIILLLETLGKSNPKIYFYSLFYAQRTMWQYNLHTNNKIDFELIPILL